MFSLRIVNVDHYLSPPKAGLDLTYSQFRGNQVKSVPVIRIFGSTLSGSKACLHVHGVFPYILVPYTGAEDAGRVMYQLASSLDKAINISMGTSFSNKQHVFKIAQVSGRPFYGYHGQDHQFLKIFFYNPLIVKRASELLQNGAVCGTMFQIHECHVPFILQFFIDYNLYGMSFIELRSVVFRKEGNPPGEPHGQLAKESFCELEADAVAVDILNRLTVEGELAVNPGLAAIWREEKERLKKDGLDSSQRPTPQRTMSEMLLKEKLIENLKYQGKCKALLREQIPYPAETQRTGSEILDASMVDSHFISSLVTTSRNQSEEVIVDEDLVFSLTQNSAVADTLDQSLVAALENLAASADVISQSVEDDSILGSQMMLQENTYEDDVSDEALAAMDFSLPTDVPADDQFSDLDEYPDLNLNEKIPQLDGIGDISGGKKKSSMKRRRKVLVENIGVENNTPSDNEEILLNNMKDNTCWPESGKQECLDEIFSDDEPFNSPIHSFEDNGTLESDSINLDFSNIFDTVLRGDPSFTCREAGSEDVFLPSKNDSNIWNTAQTLNVEEIVEKKSLFNGQEENLKPIADIFKDKKDTAEKNKYPSDSSVPSLSVGSGIVDLEKPMLPSYCEDLLNTSQLDEIFNDDLNKGLEIIYENNSQHESGESTVSLTNETEKCEEILQMLDINIDDGIDSPDEESSSVKKFFQEIGHVDFKGEEGKTNQRNSERKHESPSGEDKNDSNNPGNSVETESSFAEQIFKTIQTELEIRSGEEEEHGCSPDENQRTKTNKTLCVSPMKVIGGKRDVERGKCSPIKNNTHSKKQIGAALERLFKNKTKTSLSKQYNSHKMTDDEIKRYFSQLEFLSSRLVDISNLSDEEPNLWMPIRRVSFLKRRRRRRNRREKIEPSLRNIVKASVSINTEIDTSKLRACVVLLKRLCPEEVKHLCNEHKVQIKITMPNDNSEKKQPQKPINDIQKKLKINHQRKKNFKSPETLKFRKRACKITGSKVCKNQMEEHVSADFNKTKENCESTSIPKKLFEEEKPERKAGIDKSDIKAGITNKKTKKLTNRLSKTVESKESETKNDKLKSAKQNSLQKCHKASNSCERNQNKNKDSLIRTKKVIIKNKIESSIFTEQEENSVHSNTLTIRKKLRHIKASHGVKSRVNVKVENVKLKTARKKILQKYCEASNKESRQANKSETNSKSTDMKTKSASTSIEKKNSLKNDSEKNRPLEVVLKDIFKSKLMKKETLKRSKKETKFVKEEILKRPKKETEKENGEVDFNKMNDKTEKTLTVKSVLINNNSEIISKNKKDSAMNLMPFVCLNKDSWNETKSVIRNNLIRPIKSDECINDQIMKQVAVEKPSESSMINDHQDDHCLGNPPTRSETVVPKNKKRHSNLDCKRIKVDSRESKKATNIIPNTESVSSDDNVFDKKPKIEMKDALSEQSTNEQPKKMDSVAAMNPLVRVKKLINVTCLEANGINIGDELDSTRLNIYSLDGAVDDSSSDENVDEKPDDVKGASASALYSTPNKRRPSSSKNSRTPKTNYVPLNIKIKKSPKIKPKPERRDSNFQEVTSAEIPPTENQVEDNLSEPTNEKLDDFIESGAKRKRLDPYIEIQKLPSMQSTHQSTRLSELNYGHDKPSTSNDLKIVQPTMKRLKVSVQRLSLDTQGCSTESEDLARMKRRSSRSASHPTTLQEKIQTSNKIAIKIKAALPDISEGIVHENKTVKFDSCEKGKRVRKTLLFCKDRNLIKEEENIESNLSTSSSKLRLEIPPRKFSTDIFDSNSTSESVTTIAKVLSVNTESENVTFDESRLSEITQNTFSDLEFESFTSNQQEGDVDLSRNHSINTHKGYFHKLNLTGNPPDPNGTILLTPAFDPPSRGEVMSKLQELGLPEVVSEEPFYSDPADVTKSSEVGSVILKLKSKSVVHLEEFEGTFCSLSNLKKERLKQACERDFGLHSYGGSFDKKTVIMTPLYNPPSSNQAKLWLKQKLADKKKEEVIEHKTATKIMLPSSPGQLSDDDNDEAITISQCTPLSKTSVDDLNMNVVHHGTPEFASSAGVSPLMASTPVNKEVTQGPSTSKKRFSRVPSRFRKSLPLIKEEQLEQIQKDHSLDSEAGQSQKESITLSINQLSETRVKKLLSESKSPASMSCQIDMVTPNNSGNYRMELENLQDVKIVHEHQHLTILTIELHIHTRGDLRPNSDHDAVCCVFYNITNDNPDPSISHISGAICVNDWEREMKMPQLHCDMQEVRNERALITAFIDLVRKWDPDIFVGYEIEMLSWGYLLQRAYVLGINLMSELSRVNLPARPGDEPKEISDDDSDIRLAGRIVLNLWRFLRHEVALMSYTFENIAYHVLHQRIPLFSFRTLTSWWDHRTQIYRWQVFEHYLTRVEGIVKIMQQLDLVGRTSEFARLFGIQFYEVLSRGSQFRVESMMLRLVKPLNYVAVSPSIQQRAKMRAPESLPLIMEPESRFYSDPVIVLDFQSLYPSIIIAYNYCFSTCLGRVEHLGRSEMFEFGCTQLKVPIKDLNRLKDNLNMAPCGVAFVNQSIVKGVLPRMLEEILNTRLMVKQSMKENKGNKTLQRVLHARQLGLKLIANVTYGYTAANFSGRMPCIEVGDSVVSKARETLERAVGLVSRNSEWGARVIYGDTDSMFVLVPGKSRAEAFRIGAEIADAVTNDNPKPVKLKLEKVYQPCLLQTKKRYVGYMYESPSQEVPVYDAKGIETVRRDGCPAVAKILEKSLRILFETADVSQVKRYVCQQLGKVLSNRVGLQELTFAREYRGAAGYRPGACVPALELARQWRTVDPRAEPRVGERVPYVIVAGPPGLPLIRLVRSPHALLADDSLKLNAEYYISRVIIPPLDRCFSLIGAHVAHWYSEMPRKQQLCLPSRQVEGSRKATISQYFATANCVVCARVTADGVCTSCQQQPQCLAVTLANRLQKWQRRLALVDKLCSSCCGRPYETACTSLDCPVLYRRNQAVKDLKQADYILDLQQRFLSF